MKFKFIGQNGSLGFINGKVYDLKLENSEYPIMIRDAGMGRNNPMGRRCPYQSFEKFFENWEMVTGDKK